MDEKYKHIELTLPLIDLTRFESYEEAAMWIKETPGFYHPGWDSFIGKLE